MADNHTTDPEFSDAWIEQINRDDAGCIADAQPQTTNPELFHGWPAEKLLDFLPLASGVAISGPQLRGASDAEIAAWAHGVECASDSVKRIIEQWRKANATS